MRHLSYVATAVATMGSELQLRALLLPSARSSITPGDDGQLRRVGALKFPRFQTLADTLKLLHPELSIRTDLRKRFLREAQAANAVSHPGVVVVIDDDVADDGAAFLVMELLDGQSVEELWEAHGKRLPTRAVLTLAADLCAVLAAAHDAGVIHRDLKPANLFVTHAGELKVLDFGIARVRDAAVSSATSTGAVFGTVAFMGPEQASGLVNELGPHSDIWAVGLSGATMFTLLSGRSVHDGQSAQHIAILAATRPAPSLAMVLPDAPEEVVAIVDRALAFDKADRWPSATAMRTALCEVLTSLLESSDDATVVKGTLSETMLAVAGVKAIAERSGTLASPGNRAAFLGGTTGQPVSSGAAITEDAPTRRRGSTKWRLGAVAVVTIAGAITMGVVVITYKRAAEATPRAIPSAQIVEATAPPVVTSLKPALLNPSVTAAPSAAPAFDEPRSSVSAPLRAAKPPVVQMTPAVRPRAGTPTPAPRLNCSPPFTVQDGIQIHKPGCP